MSKKETSFTQELLKSSRIVGPESQWHKIPDVVGQRFVSEKPCDVFWLVEGRLFCLEVKVHNLSTAMPLSKIRWPSEKRIGQVQSLINYRKAGAFAYFLILFKSDSGKYHAGFYEPETVQGWKDSGLKSVKVSKLKSDASCIIRRRKHIRASVGTYWPLDEFLQRVYAKVNKD